MEEWVNKYYHIELSERTYKRVEWLINIFNAIKKWIKSFRKKKYTYVDMEISGTINRSHKQMIDGKEITIIDDITVKSVSLISPER